VDRIFHFIEKKGEDGCDEISKTKRGKKKKEILLQRGFREPSKARKKRREGRKAGSRHESNLETMANLIRLIGKKRNDSHRGERRETKKKKPAKLWLGRP